MVDVTSGKAYHVHHRGSRGCPLLKSVIRKSIVRAPGHPVPAAFTVDIDPGTSLSRDGFLSDRKEASE